MQNDKDSDFYKNILDLVPEPILVLEVKDFSISLCKPRVSNSI